MGRKYVPLIICCLLFVIAGCKGKKADQSTTSPTVQSQQATPGTTVANPATKLPQPATTGQTETNPAPTKASDTERQLNQQIAGVLYSQVKIPVMMPSYWPSIPAGSQDPYSGIQYIVGQDGYGVTITTIPEQLPVNSPELNLPANDSEANQWGNFGGVRKGTLGASAPNSVVVQKPKDGQPSVISGYQGWQDPVSFYWENGAWQCEVLGSFGSLTDDARSLTGSFKDAGELKSLQARSGKILASDANHRYTFISWVSADGQYEYTLQYDGEIADAIKIANSFSEVKQE